eukprot:g9210.t1
MASLQLKPPLVVDTGTGGVKAGIAGDKFPRFYFPTCVARPILRLESTEREQQHTDAHAMDVDSDAGFGPVGDLRLRLSQCPWLNREAFETLLQKNKFARGHQNAGEAHHLGGLDEEEQNHRENTDENDRDDEEMEEDMHMEDGHHVNSFTTTGASGGPEQKHKKQRQGGASGGEEEDDDRRMRASPEQPQLQDQSFLIGPSLWNHAVTKKCDLSYPMKDGQIDNWEDMERVWDYIFLELGVDPCEHTVLLTEPVLNNQQKRETMVEMMFERYEFGAVNVSVQGVLSLYSEGMATGVVVDSGDGCTHIVPVYEGYVQPSLVQRMNIGGRHVTKLGRDQMVSDQLVNGGVMFGGSSSSCAMTTAEVQELKESCCYVAYDLEREKKLCRNTNALDRVVALYDNRVAGNSQSRRVNSNYLKRVRLGEERFLAPEILFDPRLYQELNFDYGHQNAGVAEFVFETIMNADIDLRRTYFIQRPKIRSSWP